ncbi:MAG: hypothetical protein QOI78_2599 [Actinomycetota bacterium]|nr:hypothetical protein [Actinomycetota bacterium]
MAAAARTPPAGWGRARPRPPQPGRFRPATRPPGPADRPRCGAAGRPAGRCAGARRAPWPGGRRRFRRPATPRARTARGRCRRCTAARGRMPRRRGSSRNSGSQTGFASPFRAGRRGCAPSSRSRWRRRLRTSLRPTRQPRFRLGHRIPKPRRSHRRCSAAPRRTSAHGRDRGRCGRCPAASGHLGSARSRGCRPGRGAGRCLRHPPSGPASS